MFVALAAFMLTSALGASLFDKLKGAGGENFLWTAKGIFDTQPKILAVRDNRIGFKGADIHAVAEADPKIDQMLAKETKSLSARFAKGYPLKKLKFNEKLNEWPSRGALSLLKGDLPEYSVPESVTEDYVLLFDLGGRYGCLPNDRMDAFGRPLGNLEAVVTLTAILIDAKTKQMVGRREISEGRQKFIDVLLETCRGITSQPTNAGLTPTKAYQDALAAGKTGIDRFIYDMKNAKQPE